MKRLNCSDRGKALVQSPIRSLVPFAREAKNQGIEILHLNIGQPDIKTPQAALDAVRNDTSDVIEYGASEGMIELRETVANYYEKFDVNISRDDVYVTTGASEAIMFSLFSCLDSGDEVLIPEPFYANYIGYAQTSGINIKPLRTSIDDGFALPSSEAFFEAITDKTKAIFLCNPGNPTGNLYSREALERLAKIVKSKNLFLIVDEVYREFCYSEPFYSVLNLSEIEQNVIVIDSISKVFSSCGARVGYIVTRNHDIQHSILKYAQLRLCPPYFGQILAKACYEHSDIYLEHAKTEYDKRRQYLYGRLQNIPGVISYLPKAAFYNIVELPIDDVTHFCKWLLTDFRNKNQTVMFAPADGFYINKERGKSQMRIAYILNEQKLEMAMDSLELALEQYLVKFKPSLAH